MKGLYLTVIAVAGGLAVGGCKKHIDADDAAKKVRQFAEENIGTTTAVTCPEAEMKAGVTFTCKVTFADGGTEEMNISLTDDKGTTGDWRWKTPLGGGDKFNARIEQIIKDKAGKDAKVDCGRTIQEVPPDGLPCKATIDGKALDVVVKVSADGSASVEPKS